MSDKSSFFIFHVQELAKRRNFIEKLMIKRRPSIEQAQFQGFTPAYRSSDRVTKAPLIQQQTLKPPKNDNLHFEREDKQNQPFQIMSYHMQYEDLMKLAALHSNQVSSSCSSSSSSSSSITYDQDQKVRQSAINRSKVRAVTLPLSLDNQKAPLIRIHHIKNPNANYQQYQTKYQHFHQHSIQKKEKDLAKLKQSAKLLSVQGKKFNQSQLSNFLPRSNTAAPQDRVIKEDTILAVSQEKYNIHNREAKEIANKVKIKARANEYFKLPKEKERILDIKLREKIKSDIDSRQLREKFDNKMARLKSLSLSRMTKTPKLPGVKLAQLQNAKKSPIGQRYEADLKNFKHKLQPTHKKKLII